MTEYTLLKLNIEDAELTANAPYSRQKTAETDDTETEASTSKKGAVIAALVGLCFSVAVAYIVRKKLFGGSDADSEEPDEDITEFTVEA